MEFRLVKKNDRLNRLLGKIIMMAKRYNLVQR